LDEYEKVEIVSPKSWAIMVLPGKCGRLSYQPKEKLIQIKHHSVDIVSFIVISNKKYDWLWQWQDFGFKNKGNLSFPFHV
jgi:hypothetical protein